MQQSWQSSEKSYIRGKNTIFYEPPVYEHEKKINLEKMLIKQYEEADCLIYAAITAI